MGGYADIEAKRPWTLDTTCHSFSVTKGVCAIVAALLVERWVGLLPPESNSTYDDNFLQPEPQKYLNCGGPLISQRMEHPFVLLIGVIF